MGEGNVLLGNFERVGVHPRSRGVNDFNEKLDAMLQTGETALSGSSFWAPAHS